MTIEQEDCGMASTSRIDQLKAMLADTPDDAELRYFLAMAYVSAGESEAALQCFRHLAAECPNYVPAYVQSGQLLARLGRDDEARDVFRAGIAVALRAGDAHAAGEMESFLDSL
jgi:thioredoxin-like negative regulator of GroEL